MDLIYELIFEVVIDGSIKAYKNKSIPLIIRLLLIFVILGIYISLFVVLLLAALAIFKEKPVQSIVLILIDGIFLFYGLMKLDEHGIIKLRKHIK